jgi:hypothetical protein
MNEPSLAKFLWGRFIDVMEELIIVTLVIIALLACAFTFGLLPIIINFIWETLDQWDKYKKQEMDNG